MSLRNALSALSLALTVWGCGSDDSKAAKPAHPDLDFAAFDAAVTQFLADHGLSGASAVVVHKDWGVVHTAGYGQFAPDRIYLIASSSKRVASRRFSLARPPNDIASIRLRARTYRS